jgi:hypothetical protein
VLDWNPQDTRKRGRPKKEGRGGRWGGLQRTEVDGEASWKFLLLHRRQ